MLPQCEPMCMCVMCTCICLYRDAVSSVLANVCDGSWYARVACPIIYRQNALKMPQASRAVIIEEIPSRGVLAEGVRDEIEGGKLRAALGLRLEDDDARCHMRPRRDTAVHRALSKLLRTDTCGSLQQRPRIDALLRGEIARKIWNTTLCRRFISLFSPLSLCFLLLHFCIIFFFDLM